MIFNLHHLSKGNNFKQLTRLKTQSTQDQLCVIPLQKSSLLKGKLIISCYMRPKQHNQLSEAKIISFYDRVDKHFRFGINYDNQTNQYGDTTKSILLRKVFSRIGSSTLRALTLCSNGNYTGNLPAEFRIVDLLGEFDFVKLEIMKLWRCKIEEAEVRLLVQKQWPALKQLRLDQNALGDAGLRILLGSQVANRLELLSISYVGVTSSGLKWLATGNLNNLRQLLLYCNKLGKRGLQFLAKSLLPQLASNSVESELTNESIKSLSKAEWPNLKELDISSNKGITCDFLGHLEEVNWRLQKMRTSLTNRLSIRYFSSVVLPSTGQKQLKIRIYLEDDEMVEGKDTFFNAKVMLSQFVEY